ncbi:helix-turn-helix domain-containing protein [Candidatus Nitrotoga arctica]|uniref:Helix-turn-helix domain-containing protein n=1 Tax=Candidatus Nitrotoga arctica TaxID=453162 RepID=A0ABN8AN81_9PROT|nr:helix-turn-helix domain-containing protein [Candidatus Nitrotoga arctica]CAG9932213.1 conserved protein of unknown function [Candidatus Nitrotoga arctica]
MSIRVMSMVWENYLKGGSEKLALLALADWCNDQGSSLHPSINAIAKKINVSESQARRIIHGFIKDGYLEVIGNHSGGNPGQSRQYKLNLKNLATPSMDATPSVSATPSMDARLPLAPVRETPSTHDTLTTKNHHRTTKKISRSKKTDITLKQFLEACKENSEQAIPESDPIFEYAKTVGLEVEMIAACWQEFKADYLPTQKTYKDWRKTFRNSVRGNWKKLWFMKPGEAAQWTTAGEQARRVAA